MLFKEIDIIDNICNITINCRRVVFNELIYSKCEEKDCGFLCKFVFLKI